MKKVIVLTLALSFGALVSQAQEIGVRTGGVGSTHANLGSNFLAVDAVFSLGKFSRLHANASAGSGIGADLLYDFFYKQVTIGGEKDFNWYMGVGPSVYLGNYINNDNNVDFLLGGTFEVGLEYHFDFPLAVGVDVRPTVWFIEDVGYSTSFGAMARYVINR